MNFAYFGNKEPSSDLLKDLLITARPDPVAVDVETVSLKDRTMVGLAIATSPTDAFYFPADSPLLPTGLLERPATIYHNSLYDLSVLWDVKLRPTKIEDTIVMARLLNLPSRLTELYYWTGRQTEDMGRVLKEHKVKKVSELPFEVAAKKCCEDAMATYALYQNLKGKVDWAYYRKEMELVPILLRMSKRGIKLDQRAVKVLRGELEKQVQDGQDYFQENFDVNVASHKQLAMLLAQRGTVLPFTKSGKSLSVAKDVLRKVDDPLAKLVLSFRKVNKLLTTYIRPYDKQRRAYAEFYPDTITGRLSSRNRNLQNIPPGIRHIFIPDGQTWTDFDYSQVEMRLFAHLSKDRAMGEVYGSGGDIHRATAEHLDIPRRRAKNVNFAMIYGATPQTIAATAQVGLSEAEDLLRGYFLSYPQAGAWIRQMQREALEAGYITTLGGRVINLPIAEGNEALKRKAVNYIIQGSAAEVIKEAMRRCAHLDMAAQIHDEILGEFDPRELRSLELDRIFPEVYTPTDVKTGPNWRDLQVQED